MARVHPGGLRRPNGSGGIQAKPLASGEMRYHARLDTRYLGSFESRAAAQRAIEAARARVVMIDEVSEFDAEKYETILGTRGRGKP